ncbi:MAG: S53 family peptidase [Actinomycetota bacterium]|nr:S53 family peptidase [Actinomycetota bacterium]
MSSRLWTRLGAAVAVGLGVLALASVPAAARPYHIAINHRFGQPPTTSQCLTTMGIACYNPAQFQRAYDMGPLYSAGLNGTGKTIVIVDSFGSPTIESDLKTFDTEQGLPAPPSLRIIAPAGPIPKFDPGNATMVGWAEETSLDVEYAHAMAPGANILLVETPVAETEGVTGFPQIIASENFVINHHLGDVISQSFGATEQTFPNVGSLLNLRSAYKNALRNHVSVLAGASDFGATDAELNGVDLYTHRAVDWPASDPLVTAVGGTQLHLTDNGSRTAPDNVWNDQELLQMPVAGGGGPSRVFSRPDYQNSVQSVVGGARGLPDVSLSAAVNGGANVYLGFTGSGITPGWYVFGGTSEATPLFSGVVAVADQAAGHDLGLLNPALYSIGDGAGSGLVDITLGDNSVSFKQHDKTHHVVGFEAVPGYDMASGLGTVDGAKLVAQLQALPHH